MASSEDTNRRELLLFAVLSILTVVWCVSLYLFSAAWAVASLLLGFAVFGLFLLFSRKRRFFNSANFLLLSLFSSNSIPHVLVGYFHVDRVRTFFELGGTSHWTYNIAVTLLAGYLYSLDARLRDNLKGVIRRVSGGFAVANKNEGDGAINQTVSLNQGTINNAVHNNNYIVKKDFHREIDIAVSFIDKRKPNIALDRLQELERNHWEELGDRGKFRTIANIGFAYLLQEKLNEAASHFYRAKNILPDDLKARLAEVQADLLTGSNEEALEKARDLTSSYPENADAWALLVAADDSWESIAAAQDQVPKPLREEPNVMSSLVSLGINRDQLDVAEELARKLVEKSPCNHAKQQLATVLVRKLSLEQSGAILLHPSSRALELTESIDLLSDIIADEEECNCQMQGRARYYRAQAYRLQKRYSEAEPDFRLAIEILR